ncbi:MAG: ubiquinol-cytochrome C chaperone [Alphaproteobacteria bacterium]|nr:ubiquinol-cytochrome C chaperone [Alphaproteobacteria bacterium]
MGVPDSLDGRFDMIILHVILAMWRLRAMGGEGEKLARGLVDTLFADMDRSLREMGVGDLGVGRRVKAMARAFHGRILAYETALAEGQDSLAAALTRNVLASTGAAPGVAGLLADVARLRAALADAPDGDLLAGTLSLPGPAAWQRP